MNYPFAADNNWDINPSKYHNITFKDNATYHVLVVLMSVPCCAWPWVAKIFNSTINNNNNNETNINENNTETSFVTINHH